MHVYWVSTILVSFIHLGNTGRTVSLFRSENDFFIMLSVLEKLFQAGVNKNKGIEVRTVGKTRKTIVTRTMAYVIIRHETFLFSNV